MSATPLEKSLDTLTVAPRRETMRPGASRHGRLYLMLAPNVILFLLFTVYPIGWALRYMFYDWDGLTQPTYVGLDNFVRIFSHDPVFWQSVVNTFVIASGKLFITIPLSLGLAVLLNEKLRGRNILRAIYFMPTIMGAAVMSLVFYLIFNPYNGAVNQLLKAIGAVHKPIDWLGVGYAMFTVIVVAVWGAIGNYMVIFLAGLQTIPTELYEAAALDGADKGQQFLYITIPQLGPVTQIVLPLSTPALGVVTLFEFRHAWNEYLWPLVFTLTNPDLRPLSVGIAALRYNDTAATQWNLMLTGATISIVPLLIIYLFANRAFIGGQITGALKG